MHPLSADDMSGMRAGKEGKVKSWLNLETVACTDTGEPGVLFCSRVHNTGHHPNPDRLQYSKYNCVFNELSFHILQYSFWF